MEVLSLSLPVRLSFICPCICKKCKAWVTGQLFHKGLGTTARFPTVGSAHFCPRGSCLLSGTGFLELLQAAIRRAE